MNSLRVTISKTPRAAWPFVAFLGLFFIGGLIRPGLMSIESLLGTAAFAMILAVASYGQTVAIVQGGIDLSVANTIAFTALSFLTLTRSLGVGLALLVTLALGAMVGAVNGLIITKLNLTPIVTTIAMNGFLFGIILLLFRSSELATIPEAVSAVTSGRIEFLGTSFPAALLLGLILMVGLQLLISYSGWGRQLIVTGTSAEVARYAGISVDRTRIMGWALTGLLNAIAAIVIVGFYSQASPTMGASYLLGSVAAVVVGGASIFGGSGSFVATVGGAFVLGQVATLVSVANLGSNIQQLIYGVIVLGVVALYGRKKKA
jgi:ribose transport system permease protein